MIAVAYDSFIMIKPKVLLFKAGDSQVLLSEVVGVKKCLPLRCIGLRVLSGQSLVDFYLLSGVCYFSC